MFQHRNNQITIVDLTLPLEFFQQLEPAYALPEGAIGRDYTPSAEHVVFYPVGMRGGELLWTEGDAYLSKVGDYQTAWDAANESLPPTLEQVKAQRIALFDQGCRLEILAGFGSDALGAPHHYSAQLEDQLNLIGSTLLGVDVPYVCTDTEGIKEARLHTAAQMSQVYGDGATAKSQKIFKFHALRAQVEAAETIESVNLINWQANP